MNHHPGKMQMPFSINKSLSELTASLRIYFSDPKNRLISCKRLNQKFIKIILL